MLKLESFEKWYGRYLALKVGELSVPSGIYWIKGVNGSGKSTFLKAVAGILTFKGNIILGADISLKRQAVEYRRSVNFAEAEPLFPQFLTGLEMVKLFEETKGARIGKANQCIEEMEMLAYIDRPIGSYSSGMLKKLSLVLAFIGTPKLILLDEPLIMLDAKSLKVLYSWIVDEHATNGTSFMLSSHQNLDPMLSGRAAEIVIESQALYVK